MGFVKLSSMPTPPKLRVSTVQNLRGGLNVHDLAWQISSDQSPEMKNMWWENGVLQSRPGQTTYNNGAVNDYDDTAVHDYDNLKAYGNLYHGWYVIYNPARECFTALAGADPQTSTDILGADGAVFNVEHPEGMFFLYADVLYFKSKGGYYKITVTDEMNAAGLYSLQAGEVEVFVPTILINGNPAEKGAGSLYQPVNRMSLYRKVTYNCKSDTKAIVLPEYVPGGLSTYITVEYLATDGTWSRGTVSSVSAVGETTTLNFTGGFANVVDTTNNVRVTYCVADPEKLITDSYYRSVVDCNIVTVYGGGQGLCVVMAGAESQPNAYFWSGNTQVAMDPTYFPAEHWNLAGDISDPITAFGQQQNMLVIFQGNRIGRTVFATTEIEGRTFITMDYTTVNPMVGCDLPGSVQLVDNNLVFANTRKGVMFIKDTSSAYENNVVQISRNIEQQRVGGGFFYDLNVNAKDQVTSLDDGKRYWLFANSHAWIWDYSLGGSVGESRGLSWFYFDGIQNPSCWFGLEEDLPWYFGRDGYLRRFVTTIIDTYGDDGVWEARGEDYDKLLTLPIQDFGTYEVLKNVVKAIFVVKSSGDAVIDIEYETDYEARKDLTPIITRSPRVWVPRDLTSGRSLKFARFAVTAVRKPRCIHIRHFLVRLKNSSRAETMAFVSAQIYYTLQGVDR